MPILINEISYLTAREIEKELGVSRQTLWRWRQEGKVPAGHRVRSRQVVFTPEEVTAIREYANFVEPIDASARNQLSLFGGAGAGGKRSQS